MKNRQYWKKWCEKYIIYSYWSYGPVFPNGILGLQYPYMLTFVQIKRKYFVNFNFLLRSKCMYRNVHMPYILSFITFLPFQYSQISHLLSLQLVSFLKNKSVRKWKWIKSMLNNTSSLFRNFFLLYGSLFSDNIGRNDVIL